MKICRLIFLISLFLHVATAKAQNPNEIRVPWGTPVTLGAHSDGNYSYQWYRDGRVIANENRSTLTTTIGGSYRVKAINNGDCASDLSDAFLVIFEYSDLEIIKKSEARHVGPNETFTYEITVENKGNANNTNVVMIDALPPSLTYLGIESNTHGSATYNNGLIRWNIPLLVDRQKATLLIKVQGKNVGSIINVARVTGDLFDPDLSNNTSTDTKKIIGNIRVPNVITPNGDGKNDVLKIEGIELYKENTLSIFNRWGNEVYRSTGGYNNNWSGEGLSEGTYYYVLKLVSKEGNTQSVTGWITLLRDK
ncbi:gliding motility-associated C-terminal domain-containing protein [Pedobacter sp. ASV28]|uniref:T9SS type B sorting domain-containing protein n=1 Tax=Pedobacter sp. ASV28 TaxID=2795123 RepID=UPI0018EC8895|nr:gliding motility-associated C-terminal domain-containing protein [Pedobacter sp. ASV28]